MKEFWKKVSKRMATLVVCATMIAPNASYVFADDQTNNQANTNQNDWLDKATVPTGWITMSADANVLGMGFIKEPVRVPFYYSPSEISNDNYESLMKRFIGSQNIKFSSHRNGNLNRTPDFPNSIKLEDPSKFKDANNFTLPEIIKNSIGKDYDLKAISDDCLKNGNCVNTSFWAWSINNVIPFDIFNGYMKEYTQASDVKAEDGDVLRLQFSTVNHPFKDLGLAGYSDTSLYEAADYSKLLEQVANINSSSNKQRLLANKDIKDAYDEANNILTSITEKKRSS
ncbi:MAG: hypothetical protein LBR30_03625 [Clostridioides sp.]|jgi:hypothetical protein|nr:hypothetical protein [Clostridioides sp.]